ncbi:centrosomin isoform X2 [Drosophila busckii]|uniref:centrosomin isoform X2 n=1 Tax=Drosophila busckii TaxID=30019 RepID=UPI00083EF585|nr:centrosomin isoform X2 [Drosophila busckii]
MDQNQAKHRIQESSESAYNCTSSLKEISLIETVTSFLAENGAAEVDPKVLKHLAEALSKRIDTDACDTSPGGLHDVTMESSYNSFDAARAPVGGNHSPLVLQGRSVRELEEQMSTLRNENFNLKLRIYFMEENQHGGAREKNAGDAMAKQLIDAKVEVEVLRKRITEKTELLKDAAHAITLHEEAQKKSDAESQAMLEHMQQYIQTLEARLENTTQQQTAEQSRPMQTDILRLEEALSAAERQSSEFQAQQSLLQKALNESQESLQNCEAKITELAIKNSELVEQMSQLAELEKVANNQKLELHACLKENKSILYNISAVELELLQQQRWMNDAASVLHRHGKTLNLMELGPQLRAQLADTACELQDTQEKLTESERVREQACRTIQKLMHKISSLENELKLAKQQQAKQLNANDKPIKAAHSQSDTELCPEGGMSAGLKQRYEQQLADQAELITQLQSEVNKQTSNLQQLVNNELWEKNREVERLTKLVSSQPAAETTADDSAGEKSFTEADYTKALKRSQLLQRKVDVLLHRLADVQQHSSLTEHLRQELQATQADMESANKWRIECAEVCSVLTNRLDELAGFLNSLLKHKDVLGVLAADRCRAMRRAIDRSLDLSKSLNMTLSITGTTLADQSLAQLSKLSELLYTEADNCDRTYNSHEENQSAVKTEGKVLKSDAQPRKERRSLIVPVDNQSESEAWSEPDRKVSLARIGLEDTSSSLVGEQQHSESDSEEQACSANTAKQERSRQSERITQLEALIAQRDERLLQVQCQLVDADNRLKQEQLRVLELTQQLEQVRAQNEALVADLRAIGTQEEQEMVELQQQLQSKAEALQQQQTAYKTLYADAKVTELQLEEAQQMLKNMEAEHMASLEHARAELAQAKLTASEALEQQAQQQQEDLARDWVAVDRFKQISSQLLELQRTSECQQETERELKQTLVESELATRALKKELHESTLQASKAIMERTKAYNDKLQLEKRLDELKLQLTQLQQDEQRQQSQSQSGYTSEEVPNANAPNACSTAVARVDNPSPDLGIESDVGRVVSVELSNAQRTQLKTVELKAADSQQLIINEDTALSDEAAAPETTAAMATGAATPATHDCAKVDQEVAELRRKLIRTKRAFEDTYEKLRIVNLAKAQVERDIKNQILKTHNVLRNVRSNMENVL